MVRLLTASLVLAGLLLVVNPVQAFGCKPRCEPAPCCEMQVTYVDKVVTCYKAEWREKQVECTITKVIPREVEEVRKCLVMIPEYRDEKRVCTTYKMVPKQVEQTVTCCRMIKEEYKDPCTGCCRVVCKPEFYTQKVLVTVCEAVPEQREYTVRLCSYRAEERSYTCKRIVCDFQPEKVVKTVRYCEMVPYQTTVKVAVCTPVCCK